MAYKNIEDRRKYHREYMKQRRNLYKKLHLCTECGSEDISTIMGYKQCIKCREQRCGHKLDFEKFMLSDDELQVDEPKIKRAERFLYGLCYRCGKPVLDQELKWGIGKVKLCKECYEKNCQIAKKRKRKILAPICNTKRAWEVYHKLKASKE